MKLNVRRTVQHNMILTFMYTSFYYSVYWCIVTQVRFRSRSEVPILIFLVDHFKEINDFGGPPAPTFSPCSQNDGNWCHE